MKNNFNINEFKYNPLNPDFDLKEDLVNELIIISQRVKHTRNGIKKNEKPLEKSFRQILRTIVKYSIDITQNYTCAPIIALSLAGEYGENAREYFHKICKINKQYNVDTCDNMYSDCIKNDSEIILMKPFFILTTYSLFEKMETLINE